MMNKRSMTFYRILFFAGVLLMVTPVLLFLWLTNSVDIYPKSANAAIVTASEWAGGSQFPPMSDMQILEDAAALGNPVAQNNLAVVYLRSRRPGSSEQAKELLEAAAAQNLIQARFNLVLTLPNKFDTDPAIIRRQIDLLEANVLAGDVHSMVLLARRLYFVNRDAYVDDRHSYRLTLYETAALSDDPDYLYQYGHQIWEDYRRDHPADLVTAAKMFVQAAALGEPRGAHGLGRMLEEAGTQDVVAYLILEGLPVSPLYWYDQAAAGGLRASACAYGRFVFADFTRGEPVVSSLNGYRLWVRGELSNIPDQTLRQGLAHLDDCGTLRPRRAGPSRVFGEEALYRTKMRGTWPGTHGWAGQADRVHGLILGFGPDQDLVQSRAYLERARDVHDVSGVDGILALINE
jgi:TPR repeat protein